MVEKMPIGMIAFGLAALAGLFWVVRSLRMPPNFDQQEQTRRKLRAAMLEQEKTERREPAAEPEEDSEQ